jgi:hypothetical protein
MNFPYRFAHARYLLSDDMNDLSYLAAVAGGLGAAVIIRWAFRRYAIGGSRRLLGGVVIAGASYVGLVIYFAAGFVFVMIHPDQSQKIWAALGHGLRSSGHIVLFIAIIAGALFRIRATPAPPKEPEGNVRERLLKARADLEARIEQVQSSPVMNYRGGVPETDIIVEELAESLKEIDAALAAPE